jgi:hypothetical protein
MNGLTKRNKMAQHNYYWSCSPFADWLRGTEKLKMGTSEEWDNWTTAAKMKHNFRYWLAEDFLSDLQDFVTWPERKLNDIRYYVNNRWITRSHALTAHPRDIKPGNWCDVGNRFLPCLFNELVDFVEIEQAWHHCIWSDEMKTKYNVPWYRKGWLRLRTWRCPEAGMEYLRWAETLTNEEFLEEGEKHKAEPTYQAKAAKEIIELYTWWTTTYRNRPDPYEASGWSAHCDAMRVKYPGSFFSSLNSKDPEDRKASDKAHKLLQKIEAAYAKEDEAMMIRLIKIRESLWT